MFLWVKIIGFEVLMINPRQDLGIDLDTDVHTLTARISKNRVLLLKIMLSDT